MEGNVRPFALAVAVVLALGATSCVSNKEYNRVVGANQSLQSERDALRDQLASRSLELQNWEARVQDLQGRAAEAAWIKEQKERLSKLISDYQAGGSLAIDGVEVMRTAEGVSFRVQGEILFNSGQAEVTEGGKATLQQLVRVLNEEGKRVRIEGHTDSDPIRRSRWKSNLELSVSRAVAVADHLIASGVSADQVAVAGYGEHRPAVEGTDDAAKRQNRRVEILMLDGP